MPIAKLRKFSVLLTTFASIFHQNYRNISLQTVKSIVTNSANSRKPRWLQSLSYTIASDLDASNISMSSMYANTCATFFLGQYHTTVLLNCRNQWCCLFQFSSRKTCWV